MSFLSIRLNAKQHLIAFKYDEVIVLWPQRAYLDFCAYHITHFSWPCHSDVNDVDKTHCLILKIIEISLNFIVSLAGCHRGQAINDKHEWLQVSCPECIRKHQWPQDSRDLNPMDYHVWGAMLEAYHKLHPKPKSVTEVEEALQVIWDSLLQEPINNC